MKNQILLGGMLALILLALSLGCSAPADEEATPEPTEVAVITVPDEPTVTPSPEPTPTPAPTNTPIPPIIRAKYQLVEADGMLTIDELIAPVDGWLIAYHSAIENPRVSDVVGAVKVNAGPQENVSLEIPADWTDQSINLALVGGRSDELEEVQFGDADVYLTQLLELDTQATLPVLEVIDHEIAADGVMTVTSVSVPDPSWITVYAAEDTERTNLLGFAPVSAGTSISVAVPIRFRESETAFTAYLASDTGRRDVFEPETDLPLDIGGQLISADFSLVFPPEIVAYHQPGIGGVIDIEHAYSQGDGWIVVYEDDDDDGQPGFIIGFAPVSDGINRNISITLNRAFDISPRLMLTFHDDTGSPGEFGFPGSDPIRFYNDNAYFVEILTDLGPILVAADTPVVQIDNQTLANLDTVMLNVPAWLVIYNDDEGQPGTEALGQLWLPAGIHRDVALPIELPAAGDRVHAFLRSDNGNLEEFEPDTTDFPLQFDGSNITLPLSLP